MQFTRPSTESAFRTDVTVTANMEVADRLITELGSSEWGPRLLAVGDVPGFVVSFTFDLGATTLYDAVRADAELDVWLDETVEKITKELYGTS